MEKDKKKEEVVFIDATTIENIFTDIVQLNLNNETVKIRLAVKDIAGEKAVVSHNVIMTLPHFLRFADICSKSASNVIAQIKNQSDK